MARLSSVLSERRRAFRAAESVARRAGPARARSVYAAAAVNRLNLDWVMSYQSADWELRSDLRTMRVRARQLLRDSPFARRYVELCAENIIGHGVRLQADDAITAAWQRWGKLGTCTADRRYSWHDVEEAAVKAWKGEGECLIQMLPGFANGFGFALLLLDPDQLDEAYNVPGGAKQNEIRMGVEVDRYGAPVAYHLWRRHPSEPRRDQQRVRVPADLIVHLYDAARAGQTRGYPALATVQSRLHMLDATDEAVLVNLRVSASKMGFFTVDPDKGTPVNPDAGGTELPMEASPGNIPELPPGYSFTPWDTGQPPAEYDPFSKAQLRAIAVGLGVTYSSLSGDMSMANYSSERADKLVEREHWRAEQAMVIEHLHERVFRQWATYAALAGAIDLPRFDADALADRVSWQPRGFDWVDPQKDMDAELREVSAGVNSLTRIAAKKGRELKDVLRERADEIALAEEMGVPISLTPSAPAKPAPEADQTNEEDVNATGAPAGGRTIARVA